MIVLLTDFGLSEYVGVMKGVIYSIHSGATIVDLCHDVSAQNITEASWLLSRNYKYFLEGAVFCCVVDPGVGTERKALGVKTNSYYFVAPDNGLLWETLKQQEILVIRQIPTPPNASRTFHGRDVFAKAAAITDLGRFDELGNEVEQIEKLELYQNGREGMVVRIDRFGNVITNLTSLDTDRYSVKIGQQKYTMDFYRTYEMAEEDMLFLIEGSNNTLEISVRNSSANDKLHLEPGQKITISPKASCKGLTG
jgi:S-adenosylmethionine hydrolase